MCHGAAAAFVVCAGSLAFSVTVFTAVAIITLIVILLRRVCFSPSQELGGSVPSKYATACLFLLLYGIYLALSILRAENAIEAFADYLADMTANPDCV